MAPPEAPLGRRLLLDTNAVVGALLWSGPPLRLVEQAMEDGIELISSPVLMAELEHTLNYPKFTKRLVLLHTDVATLMSRYGPSSRRWTRSMSRAWSATTPTTITSSPQPWPAGSN
jgi:hypothetical protein